MSFYAVKIGKDGPMIYRDWTSCQKAVSGFSGAIFKKFSTKKDAEEFIGINDTQSPEKSIGTPTTPCFYTDGSFQNGKMGFAVFRVDKKQLLYGPLKGCFSPSSNQRAELGAILHAVLWIERFQLSPVTIYTDSRYSMDTLTTYLPQWQKKFGKDSKKWRTTTGDPPANLDLLIPIFGKLENVRFEHVKAHAGTPANELVDTYAKNGLTALTTEFLSLTDF